MRTYYVYVLTNNSGTLYVGMTNDLYRRLQEHRDGVGSAFTSRYKVHRLLYFEDTSDVKSAFEREKQLKGWTRARKLELIKAINPKMQDLSEEWFESMSDARAPRNAVPVPAAHGNDQALGSIAQGGSFSSSDSKPAE